MITKKNSLALPFLLLAAAWLVLSFTAPAHAQEVQVDLSSTSALCGGHECFNADGIFTNGTTFLGTAFMDGTDAGNCTPPSPFPGCPDAYSAETLGLSSSTPPTLTPASVGAPFTFGTVNTVDCGPSTSAACILDTVNLTASPGVVITLPTTQQTIYSTMIMLGNGVNGSHAGQVTATYTTGSPDVFPQTFSDWCSFGGHQYESIAEGPASGMRINATGVPNTANCSLYAYTYPLDFTRNLQSITVTDEDGSGAMFAFAITLKPPTYTIDGGVANPASVAAGSTSTATVTVNPQPGYTGTVSLSCSISPNIVGDPVSAATAPTCSLSPTSVTVTTGETTPPTTTLTFTAAKSSSAMSQRPHGLFYAFWLPAPGLALLGFGSRGSRSSRRRRLLGLLLLGMLLASVAFTPACVSTVHLGSVGTPPGQYTISITGIDQNKLTQASNPAGTTNAVVVNVTDN
jgi:hypothetical protein